MLAKYGTDVSIFDKCSMLQSIIYGKINICVPLPSTVKEIIVSYMVRLIFVYPRHQPQGKYLK